MRATLAFNGLKKYIYCLQKICKRAALKPFAKFLGNRLHRTLLKKLLKKRLLHSSFPVNVLKFFRKAFLRNISWRTWNIHLWNTRVSCTGYVFWWLVTVILKVMSKVLVRVSYAEKIVNITFSPSRCRKKTLYWNFDDRI